LVWEVKVLLSEACQGAMRVARVEGKVKFQGTHLRRMTTKNSNIAQPRCHNPRNATTMLATPPQCSQHHYNARNTTTMLATPPQCSQHHHNACNTATMLTAPPQCSQHHHNAPNTTTMLATPPQCSQHHHNARSTATMLAAPPQFNADTTMLPTQP
jgi:hypothetical protein